MPKSVYDIIKKQNGEAFAKAIRRYDDGIFEIENLPKIVRYAGRESEPLLGYLESLKLSNSSENKIITETPFELLDRAGYNAFYADTLEKQNSIRKYFKEDEELCTFKDPSRYKKYYIIHAIKKNVDEILRQDFIQPERHDRYGTSVLSIQIWKKGGFIKITNRYNHTVAYPDNTFNSNPDNIIPGLSQSLKNHFDVDFAAKSVMLENGFILWNNQILKIHTEEENIYFGDDFYLKDGQLFEINKDYEVLIDTTIVNLKTGEVLSPVLKESSFQTVLHEELANKKISIKKNAKYKSLLADGLEIAKFIDGYLIAFYSHQAKEIGNQFFNCHPYIQEIKLHKATSIGMDSLIYCPMLSNLEMNLVEEIGCGSVCSLNSLKELELPSLKILKGFNFSYLNLKKLFVPKLEKILGPAINNCPNLEELDFPSLIKARQIIDNNNSLKIINAPKLETLTGFSFYCCPMIECITLPALKRVENCFVYLTGLKKLDLPNLEMVNSDRMAFTRLNLKELNLVSLKKADKGFLTLNNELEKVFLPELEKAGVGFLSRNHALKVVYVNRLKRLEFDALKNSHNVLFLRADSLESVSLYAIKNLLNIKRMYAPNLNDETIQKINEVRAFWKNKESLKRNLNASFEQKQCLARQEILNQKVNNKTICLQKTNEG